MMNIRGTQSNTPNGPEDLTLASIRDKGLQRRLLFTAMGMLALYGVFLFIVSLIASGEVNPGSLGLATVMLLFIVLGRYQRLQGGVAVAVVVFMLVYSTLAGAMGLGASIYVLTTFMLCIVLANSLISTTAGIVAAVYSVGALVVMLTTNFALPVQMGSVATNLANSFGSTSNIIMASIMLVYHTRKWEQRWEQTRQYAGVLDAQNQHLQADIERLDVQLVQRSRYLNTTAAITRDSAVHITDGNSLMAQVADTISEQLDFYHVGLFVIDEANLWAVLRAASSEGGKAMMSRHHRLRVGSQGIVGYVAQTGRSRIADDVDQDTVHLTNPDLPETRSEVALPLVVQGSVLGVLDVQSEIPGAFTEEDVSILQVLADQVAITVTGSRQLISMQAALDAASMNREVDTTESWRELLRSGEHRAYVADEYALTAAEMVSRPGMQESFATGDTVIKQAEDAPDSLAIPIRMRGEVVGVINGRKKDETETWTEDDVSLLQSLTDQLNIALEGAQLYEDSQRRATRERLVREVTDQMRSAVTWEELLQTAVQQMADTVQAPRAFVQWSPPEDAEGNADVATAESEEASNA